MGNATSGMNPSNAKAKEECRERFMAIFNERYAHYFEFLDGYTSNHGKARLRCKVCGHEFKKSGNFARIGSNVYCPNCGVHRDDEIHVPADGRLTERLNELYASGMTLEQIASATGIMKHRISKLVDDASRVTHAENYQPTLSDYNRRAHESKVLKDMLKDIMRSFADMEREISSYNADKALAKAMASKLPSFDDAADYAERFAPTFATCKHCGKVWLFWPSDKRYGRKKPGPYCSHHCYVKANRHNSNVGHRLRKYGNGDAPRDVIKLDEVIERDRGICYICGCETSKDDHYYVGGWFTIGDTYPTIDHVIPLAQGGTHTWSNVRLACRLCNSTKGASLTPTP